MKQKIILLSVLVLLAGGSIATATTLYDFKKPADGYIISQVGQEYFGRNFEYLGDKPYPTDTPNSNLRIVQYTHKIAVGDYSQDITVTIWFNFKNGVWEIGNGYGTNAEELPNCVADKTKCMPFEITKEKAIEIAKNNGAFDDCAEKYTAKIHFFYGNVNSYVWNITTYKSDLNGKTAIIDLNTGNLISIGGWQVLYTQPEYKDAVFLTNQQALCVKPFVLTPTPSPLTQSPLTITSLPVLTESGQVLNIACKTDVDCGSGLTCYEGKCYKSASPRVLISPTVISRGSGFLSPSNGKCSDAYITSEDGKDCLKIDAYSVPGKLIVAPSVSGEGQITIKPSDGKCPSEYILSKEGECLKPLIPTIFVSPTPSSLSVTFSSGQITVSDVTKKKEISVAPAEGLKVVVSGQIPIIIQKEATDGTLTISRSGITASVSTEETVKGDQGKLFVSGQELKVMPDSAVVAVNDKVGLPMQLQSVKITTEEREQETAVLYEVVSTKEAKILGLFKVTVPITASVNAQTGVVEQIRKPWWNFLAR
ncbi:MAG: hypothetical protein WC897_06205 [Candidatus Gracilibacteria bacterium]